MEYDLPLQYDNPTSQREADAIVRDVADALEVYVGASCPRVWTMNLNTGREPEPALYVDSGVEDSDIMLDEIYYEDIYTEPSDTKTKHLVTAIAHEYAHHITSHPESKKYILHILDEGLVEASGLRKQVAEIAPRVSEGSSLKRLIHNEFFLRAPTKGKIADKVAEGGDVEEIFVFKFGNNISGLTLDEYLDMYKEYKDKLGDYYDNHDPEHTPRAIRRYY